VNKYTEKKKAFTYGGASHFLSIFLALVLIPFFEKQSLSPFFLEGSFFHQSK
jgi:hypothetical protein